MNPKPELNDLLRDPSRYYANPAAVVDDTRLTLPQKLEVLKAWPFEAQELEAVESPLNGGPDGTLHQLRQALERLYPQRGAANGSRPIAMRPSLESGGGLPRPVHTVMRPAPAIAHARDSLRSTARRMADNRQRMLVTDGEALIGSLSLAAALRAALLTDRPETATVGEVETAPIAYCQGEDTLADALRCMASQKSAHLAILNRRGDLIGDIALCDLALEACTLPSEMRTALRRLA